MSQPPVETAIAPWLTVTDAVKAVDFYKQALGAVEVYRLDGDDGNVVIAQMQVDGAAFWVQGDPASPIPAAVRMILTVVDPDALFHRATTAGATVVATVHEEYGWRTGRVSDPFGHDWEFSRPLVTSG